MRDRETIDSELPLLAAVRCECVTKVDHNPAALFRVELIGFEPLTYSMRTS